MKPIALSVRLVFLICFCSWESEFYIAPSAQAHNSHIGWSPVELDWVQTLKERQPLLDWQIDSEESAIFESLKGSPALTRNRQVLDVHKASLTNKNASRIRVDEQFSKHKKLFENPSGLPVLFKVKKSQSLEAIKKPLFIYLPGVFGTTQELRSIRHLIEFEKLGHVLIIPNPLSSQYLEAKPTHRLGDIDDEADAILSVIRHAKTHIFGINQIERTHLIGFSYGGFVATAIAAMESEKEATHPEIDGQVIVNSPPINLVYTAEKLDSFLQDLNDPNWKKLCYHRHPMSIVQNLFKSHQHVEKADMICSKSVFVNWGFAKKMVESERELASRDSYAFIRDQSPARTAGFMNFLEHYSHQAYQDLRNSNKGHLLHHLGRACSSQHTNIKILASWRDPLSQAGGWLELAQNRALSPYIALVDFGGHGGFESDADWYSTLLKLIFNQYDSSQ